MTQRAKLAADELRRRGWSIDGPLVPTCARCGAETGRGASYCAMCGERVAVPDAETMADLEAAISVAITADRERICNALPGGHHVDPQWVADMVRGAGRP